MPLNIGAFETTLQAWVAEVLGVPVIFEDQKGVRPLLGFASLNITGIIKSNQDETLPSAPDARYKSYRVINVNASIFGFDNGVLEKADMLVGALGQAARKTALTTAGIAVYTISEVTNVSSLLEDGYEKRAAVSFRLGVAHETLIPDGDGIIERVNLTGTLDGAANGTKEITLNIGD